MAAGPGLTLDDWAEILGLDGLTANLIAGEMSPGQARQLLASRRDVYPGVQLDYVRVLDAFGDFVAKVEEAIAEQNAALARFNASMADVGETFRFDPTRLLTVQERGDLERLQSDFKRQAEDQQSAARRQGEEAEAIEEEIESLQAEMEDLEGDAEDLQEQIEDLVEEIESMEGE